MLHLIGNQQIIKKTKQTKKRNKHKNKQQTTNNKQNKNKQTKNNKHIQKPKKFQNNGTNFKTREDMEDEGNYIIV
jgi:hypothetical protein